MDFDFKWLKKTHVAFLWPACFPLKFKQEKLKYTTVCTPSHSSDSFSFPHCLPNGLGFFPAVHPFPNPINSSCFRRQNNTLQTSPFIHSWHRTKLSPPSAGYLTHVSARLLYVNSGAHTHTHRAGKNSTEPHTYLLYKWLLLKLMWITKYRLM